MRVADVRKKYPEFFVTVEAAVWDDCIQAVKPSKWDGAKLKRIAYNAAAVATLELHKIASQLRLQRAPCFSCAKWGGCWRGINAVSPKCFVSK
jgi:hypothetical protein